MSLRGRELDRSLLSLKLELDREIDERLLDVLEAAIDRYEEGGGKPEDARVLLEAIETARARFGQLPQKIEGLEATVAGRLLSPWFPCGIWRKVAMIFFFALGLMAFMTPLQWLLWFSLVSLCFSPRLVGEAAVLVGRFSAGKNQKPT